MSERTLTVATPDGPMEAYLAVPEGAGRFPAVVVVQEAFGVNAHIQDVCRRLAREGIIAIAPELFHRTGRGVVIGYEDLASVMPHFSQLSNETLVTDVQAALETLRGLREVEPGRVGVIGFCVGGFASFLAACRTDVRVSVAFYGGGIVKVRPGLKLQPLLAEAGHIRSPILMVFGDKDPSIPLEEIETIRSRLNELAVEHEIVIYPNAGHGFFCEARASYHAESAALAWTKTLAFLRENLAP